MPEQRGGFYTIAAWQKGDDLVVEIYQVSQQFPRHELYGLTSQLRRAAVSVPANIAEADVVPLEIIFDFSIKLKGRFMNLNT